MLLSRLCFDYYLACNSVYLRLRFLSGTLNEEAYPNLSQLYGALSANRPFSELLKKVVVDSSGMVMVWVLIVLRVSTKV